MHKREADVLLVHTNHPTVYCRTDCLIRLITPTLKILVQTLFL